MTFHLLSIAVLLLLAVELSAEESGGAHGESLPVGGLIEHSFVPREAIEQPFLAAVWVIVDVPAASGARSDVAIPAFYDGDGAWRIRYTPQAPGCHRIARYLLGEDADTAAVLDVAADSPREYQVAPGPFRAFPRPSGETVQQFVFNDGTPYFPIGHNAGWSSVDGYEKMFRAMHEAGLNWSRVWMPHWSGQSLDWVMGKSLARGELDLGAARRMDRIIALAEENAIQIQLVLQHHGQFSTFVNPTWDNHPWNAANGGWLETPSQFFTDPEAIRLTRAKYRYIVARWGYSPAIMAWELFNEVQYTDGYQGEEALALWTQAQSTNLLSLADVSKLMAMARNLPATPESEGPSQWQRLVEAWNRKTQHLEPQWDYGLGRHTVGEWHRGMARYLRSLDPYPRMITTSCPPLDSPVWDEMDFYQVHLYEREMIAPMVNLPGGLSAYDKPVFIAEMGDHEIDDPLKDDGRYMHGMMWSGLFSGASGAAQVWAWDQAERHNWYTDFRAMTRFAAAARLAERSYAPASPLAYRSDDAAGNITSFALESNGAFIFWLYDKDTINTPEPASHEGRVVLPAHFAKRENLTVTWWDTRSGEVLARAAVPQGTESELPTPRFRGDVAAIIEENR